MKVEFTARQYEITPNARETAEAGLKKIEKILGNKFEAQIILSSEKHRYTAEITINVRNQQIVCTAEATDMLVAIDEMMEKAERQVIKYKDRWRTKKRQPKPEWDGMVQAPQEQVALAVGMGAATAVPVVVHAFPASVRLHEAHLVESRDAVAMRPMTLEEAVKEAEFRDREVFVFRDSKAGNRTKVLHRKRDGKMEIIEVP